MNVKTGGSSKLLRSRLRNFICWTFLKTGSCVHQVGPGSHSDIHVHVLCVSYCKDILRNSLGSHSGNLAFVLWKCQPYCSLNNNKMETASSHGIFHSVVSAGVLAFLAPTCLLPQLWKTRLTWQNLNQIWNTVAAFSSHLFLGSAFCHQKVLVIASMYISFQRQNTLSFDDLWSPKGREEANGKVIVALSHTLSCWAT